MESPSTDTLNTSSYRHTYQLKKNAWGKLSNFTKRRLSTEQICVLYNSRWHSEPGHPLGFQVKFLVTPNNPFELGWSRQFDGARKQISLIDSHFIYGDKASEELQKLSVTRGSWDPGCIIALQLSDQLYFLVFDDLEVYSEWRQGKFYLAFKELNYIIKSSGDLTFPEYEETLGNIIDISEVNTTSGGQFKDYCITFIRGMQDPVKEHISIDISINDINHSIESSTQEIHEILDPVPWILLESFIIDKTLEHFDSYIESKTPSSIPDPCGFTIAEKEMEERVADYIDIDSDILVQKVAQNVKYFDGEEYDENLVGCMNTLYMQRYALILQISQISINNNLRGSISNIKFDQDIKPELSSMYVTPKREKKRAKSHSPLRTKAVSKLRPLGNVKPKVLKKKRRTKANHSR